jgi:hypothetical protein
MIKHISLVISGKVISTLSDFDIEYFDPQIAPFSLRTLDQCNVTYEVCETLEAEEKSVQLR